MSAEYIIVTETRAEKIAVRTVEATTTISKKLLKTDSCLIKDQTKRARKKRKPATEIVQNENKIKYTDTHTMRFERYAKAR